MSIDKLNQTVQEKFLEKVTGGLQNINTDHAAIHKGYGKRLLLSIGNILGSATKVYRISGPSSLYAHIKNIYFTGQGSQAVLKLIKDATKTADGTLVTNSVDNSIVNCNDNGSDDTQLKVYEDATFAGGVLWDLAKVNGDTVGTATSSGGATTSNDNEESVTKTGSVDYFISITNLTTDTLNNVFLKMFFYEESIGLVE